MAARPEDRKVQTESEELLSRIRRIETRLTQLMIAMGVTTAAQKPAFARSGAGAQLSVPSPHASLREIMSSIPAGWQGVVDVLVGDELVVRLARPESSGKPEAHSGI